LIFNAVLDTAPLHSANCCTIIMGVVSGALGQWAPEYVISIIWPLFCQFNKNNVLRLNEHGFRSANNKVLFPTF